MLKTKSLSIFVVLLYVANFAYSQNISCKEKVQKLLIDKIESYNSKDLIPYYSKEDHKWGFFDRNTKKVLTEPIIHGGPEFFNPTLNFYYSFETNDLREGCTGEIAESKNNYKILYLRKSENEIRAASYNNIERGIHYVKEDVKGFEVDEKGELISLNPRFYDEENDKPLITKIIYFKDKLYAITKIIENNKTYYTIINQNGEEFSNYKRTNYYTLLKQI